MCDAVPIRTRVMPIARVAARQLDRATDAGVDDHGQEAAPAKAGGVEPELRIVCVAVTLLYSHFYFCYDTLNTRPRLNFASASLERPLRCRLSILDRVPSLRSREGLALRPPRFQPPAPDAPAVLAAPKWRRIKSIHLVRDWGQFWCLGYASKVR